MKSYCLVALNSTFNNSMLCYEEGVFQNIIKQGHIVDVPISNHIRQGIVIKTKIPEEIARDGYKGDIKAIKTIHDGLSILPEKDLELFEWVSKYYHYNLGILIFDFLPERPKEKLNKNGDKQVFNVEKRIRKIIKNKTTITLDLPVPNSYQQEIVNKIKKYLPIHDNCPHNEHENKQRNCISAFSKHLIHGITGSGKTIIYLHLIKDIISTNKQSVLFMLPEINLTPQFLEMFSQYIDAPIVVYSSETSPADRRALWIDLIDNIKPVLVIGVRSSVFLPIQNLGMIVVDEEHDNSFKQEDHCPYNARDVAIKKASMNRIPIVLGSATPMLENYYNYKFHDNGEKYYPLKIRARESRLPEIELIDMRESKNLSSKDKEVWPFHPKSVQEIKLALDRNEQVLVFVNRLGFSNYYQCNNCGYTFNCPNCSVKLRYFKNRNEVSCHYCSYKVATPDICPECQGMSFQQKGFGTEKLQDQLQKIFPNKSIERFDRDEIKTFKQLDERLKSFHDGNIDILVGTQMLSKGHNFKKVNLVLILGIDSQLNFPDFRSSERVYQLLTQVSGRSGRFGEKSKVIVQTLGVNDNLFKYVVDHTFDDFYKEELQIRKLCNCPPFFKLAMIYITTADQKLLSCHSIQAKNIVDDLALNHFKEVEILGPRPAFVEKRVNKFTWSMMIRSKNTNELHNLISNFRKIYKADKQVQVRIDVDPYQQY